MSVLVIAKISPATAITQSRQHLEKRVAIALQIENNTL